MSYDFKLEFEKKKISLLKKIIDSNPHTNNGLFSPDKHYHMEIDIENEGFISVHIPYAFMNAQPINFDFYLDTIKEIASYLETDAYDLQEEKYLNDPLYLPPKTRKLNSRIHGKRFNKFKIEQNRIILFGDEEPSTLELDLNTLEMQLGKNADCKDPVYPPFSIIKRFDDEYSDYFALRHWNEKTVRIYRNSKEFNNLEEAVVWDMPCYKEIKRCGKVQHLVFNPDGTMFLSAYKSKTLKLWDLKKNKSIRKYTSFSSSILGFNKLNEQLIFTFSPYGIKFFEYNTGDFILQICPINDSWFSFDNKGQYEGAIKDTDAYELDYKDNKFSESFCFIPDLGFGTYRPAEKWKLHKVKRLPASKRCDHLIQNTLSNYF